MKCGLKLQLNQATSKKKKKEYNYIVKAKVSKRFIFNPKLEIYSVVIE